eukprot:COSAG05_NODE_73_length_21807_cov_283.593698_3_plen_195_part_00
MSVLPSFGERGMPEPPASRRNSQQPSAATAAEQFACCGIRSQQSKSFKPPHCLVISVPTAVCPGKAMHHGGSGGPGLGGSGPGGGEGAGVGGIGPELCKMTVLPGFAERAPPVPFRYSQQPLCATAASQPLCCGIRAQQSKRLSPAHTRAITTPEAVLPGYATQDEGSGGPGDGGGAGAGGGGGGGGGGRRSAQ